MSNHLTRRDALRRGAAATGAATVGVAGFSGTAAATLDCPRTIGYWKNQPDVARQSRSRLRVARGSDPIPVDEALSILETPPRRDKALIAAKQIVAAILNKGAILYGDGRICEDTAEAIDRGALREAINWLGCVDEETGGWGYLDDPERYDPVRSWTNACGVDGEALKDRLDAFNDGRLCDGCGGDRGGAGGDDERHENGNGGERGDGGGEEGNGHGTGSGGGRGSGNDRDRGNGRGNGGDRGNGRDDSSGRGRGGDSEGRGNGR